MMNYVFDMMALLRDITLINPVHTKYGDVTGAYVYGRTLYVVIGNGYNGFPISKFSISEQRKIFDISNIVECQEDSKFDKETLEYINSLDKSK